MIDLIEQTIDSKYHLKRDGRNWLIEGIELQAPGRHSFGFTLDKPQARPFAFLGNEPPEHITKMCDAIVVVSYREAVYVFSIEIKTGNKDHYRKQIVNAKLFCDWLFALYGEHGYSSEEPVHIGLLVWEPRRQLRKGKTAHGADMPRKIPNSTPFKAVYEVRNQPSIALRGIIDLVRKGSG